MKLFITALCSMISTACFASSSPSSKVLTLTSDNHVVLNDEINGKTVSTFLKDFLNLKEDNRIVFISSPGGSVTDGMHLIQVVRDEKAANKDLHISCYVDEAASMAFGIVQAICDERLGGSTSTLMQHQAAYGVSGTDNQIVSRIKMISSILKVLDSIQAKRIGITVEELRRRSSDEWWTVGQEAVSSHVLDNLSPIVCSKDLLNEKKNVKFASLFGSGTAVFSKCPLLSAPVDVSMDDHKPVHELVKKLFERTPLSERVIRYK
jgi:ATP-dependent protease ClpP protease subunit